MVEVYEGACLVFEVSGELLRRRVRAVVELVVEDSINRDLENLVWI